MGLADLSQYSVRPRTSCGICWRRAGTDDEGHHQHLPDTRNPGLWRLLFKVPLSSSNQTTLIGCCLVSYMFAHMHVLYISITCSLDQEVSEIASSGTALSSGTGFL